MVINQIFFIFYSPFCNIFYIRQWTFLRFVSIKPLLLDVVAGKTKEEGYYENGMLENIDRRGEIMQKNISRFVSIPFC